MERIKNYIVIAVFALLIFGLGIWHAVLPDAEISRSERRKLDQIPTLSAEGIFSGDYMEELESYLLDQFPMREGFRNIKARLRFDLFRQADNNDIYLHNGSVIKMEYPLDEKQLAFGIEKINSIYENHLQGMNVYYSIIPDKNYFAAGPSGHMSMDYEKLVAEMNAGLENIEYIDIFPLLGLEDYYRTDSHWKQELVFPVAEALAEAMGIAEHLTPFENYQPITLDGFYGVYYGQSALAMEPDTMTYMVSQETNRAKVTSLEYSGARPVYVKGFFENNDAYDLFLSGAQAILTIECPNARTDRELIIFRDSFTSSLAPYFTGAYAKITLVDMRYTSSQLLPNLVSFEDQDVLFLYSTSLLNSAGILK